MCVLSIFCKQFYRAFYSVVYFHCPVDTPHSYVVISCALHIKHIILCIIYSVTAVVVRVFDEKKPHQTFARFIVTTDLVGKRTRLTRNMCAPVSDPLVRPPVVLSDVPSTSAGRTKSEQCSDLTSAWFLLPSSGSAVDGIFFLIFSASTKPSAPRRGRHIVRHEAIPSIRVPGSSFITA